MGYTKRGSVGCSNSWETDTSLRTFLDKKGMTGSDISRLLKAGNARLFHEAVAETYARNRGVDPEMVQAEVDQAGVKFATVDNHNQQYTKKSRIQFL